MDQAAPLAMFPGISALRLSEIPAELPPHWDAAQAARPAGALAFLEDARIPSRRAALGLPPQCDGPLLAVAQEIRKDEDLAAVAWYLHWRIFVGAESGVPEPPSLEARLGELSGAFFLLLALEFAPALNRLHLARGYPEEVTAQCLVAPIIGYLGLDPDGGIRFHGRQLCWLRTYFDFPYVRLGRLAFQLMPFAAPIEAWRRQADGMVIALARDGLAVSGDGLVAHPGTAPAWTCRMTRTNAFVEGHPINPSGTIGRDCVRLERSAWVPLLSAGDPILSIHIPPGGGMDLPSVQESFRQARAFFARHHPETPARAFWCATWFLDPQLAHLLPSHANPLRLQRCLYLHPGEPWADGGLWFVFRCPTHDPSILPRETSVQRALADFLATGGHWNGGAGFLPIEDAGNLVENKWRVACAAFSQ